MRENAQYNAKQTRAKRGISRTISRSVSTQQILRVETIPHRVIAEAMVHVEPASRPTLPST